MTPGDNLAAPTVAVLVNLSPQLLMQLECRMRTILSCRLRRRLFLEFFTARITILA